MVVFLFTRAPERAVFPESGICTALSSSGAAGFSVPELTIPRTGTADSRRAIGYARGGKINSFLRHEIGPCLLVRRIDFRTGNSSGVSASRSPRELQRCVWGNSSFALVRIRRRGSGAALRGKSVRVRRRRAGGILPQFSGNCFLIPPGREEMLRRYLRETRGISAAVNPGPSLLPGAGLRLLSKSAVSGGAAFGLPGAGRCGPETASKRLRGRRIETYGSSRCRPRSKTRAAGTV